MKKTQEAIARALGIHVRQYQHYEADDTEPKVKKAIAIAKALDSTCEELWQVEEKKSAETN